MIIRKPHSIDRFFEVLATMPNPGGVSYITDDPENSKVLELVAVNHGGICQYRVKCTEPHKFNKILDRFKGALNE